MKLFPPRLAPLLVLRLHQPPDPAAPARCSGCTRPAREVLDRLEVAPERVERFHVCFVTCQVAERRRRRWLFQLLVHWLLSSVRLHLLFAEPAK